MIVTNPPHHTSYRRFVPKAFTIKTVGALRPRVRQIADQLLTENGPAALTGLDAGLCRGATPG